MASLVSSTMEAEGFATIDASASTATKDFLARIVELIRATGFTIAVFSEDTRPTAMANIMLELGFVAMLGKPLMIVKSRGAPSDLTRTDWIEFDPGSETGFREELRKGARALREQGGWELQVSEVSLEARNMDCAVLLEHVRKAFLLSGEAACIEAARAILRKVEDVSGDEGISDLERWKYEVRTFIRQAGDARNRASAEPH